MAEQRPQNLQSYAPHRRSKWTWLRYHWWVVLIHGLLIVLGLINLYPFFWMLGTSVKAEAEASDDRLRPVPVKKYALAEGTDPNTYFPFALEPGLQEAYRDFLAASDRFQDARNESEDRREAARENFEAAETFYRQNLSTLVEKKLQALQIQQRRAMESELLSRLAVLNVSEDPNVIELRRREAIVKELRNGWESEATWLARERGKVDARIEQIEQVGDPNALTLASLELLNMERTLLGRLQQQAQREAENYRQRLDSLEQQVADHKALFRDPQASGAQDDPWKHTRKVLTTLIEADLLVRQDDPTRYWPTDGLLSRNWPASFTDKQKRIAAEVQDYYTVTPREYAKAASVDLPTARGHLMELNRAGNVMTLVQPVSDGNEPVYTLGQTARGAIYKDLLPRQIATLYYMAKENERRSESRTTYATDRWAADDYAKKYLGESNVDLAYRELSDMSQAGLLTDGTFQWINYWVVLKEENLLLNFATSVIITASVVILTVLISSMLGYALARIRFPGKFLVLGIMIAASVLPREARVIPVFKMLLSAHALQNLWGMVLWLTTFGVGNALLMAGFFLTLPREVDEAAEVDGAGIFRKFFDIALPMARPIVMTVGLFAFLTAWNNFLIPMLCTISRPSMQPLAVAVYNFQQGHPGKWHQINAAAAIMIVPVILMFLLVQRHVVKSIAVGAVKG